MASCAAPEEAPAAAAGSAFRWCSRPPSPALAHKSESGGVALNLKSEAEVAEAAGRLAGLADEVLVEQMVQDACASSSSASRRMPSSALRSSSAPAACTPSCGAIRSRCCCRRRAEIATALSRLHVSKLIDGFRGRSGDREAAISAIEAVARFAVDHAARLEELDVNPLMVLATGKGAVAADALIRMRE
jgi:acetate---CoA ligase (ADP-forming)